MLGVAVHLDPALLGELVTTIGDGIGQGSGEGEASPVPMASVSMTDGMQGAVERLLRSLHDPAETAAMGASRVRDVVFEALRGEQGPALRALVLHQGITRASFRYCRGCMPAMRKTSRWRRWPARRT